MSRASRHSAPPGWAPGPGASDQAVFRVACLRQLRDPWRRDGVAFLTLIELASGGNAPTLVDGLGDEPHAPWRIPAAALKRLAATMRTEARRPAQRPGQQTPHGAPLAAS